MTMKYLSMIGTISCPKQEEIQNRIFGYVTAKLFKSGDEVYGSNGVGHDMVTFECQGLISDNDLHQIGMLEKFLDDAKAYITTKIIYDVEMSNEFDLKRYFNQYCVIGIDDEQYSGILRTGLTEDTVNIGGDTININSIKWIRR